MLLYVLVVNILLGFDMFKEADFEGGVGFKGDGFWGGGVLGQRKFGALMWVVGSGKPC